jgi:hypothetical protein
MIVTSSTSSLWIIAILATNKKVLRGILIATGGF